MRRHLREDQRGTNKVRQWMELHANTRTDITADPPQAWAKLFWTICTRTFLSKMEMSKSKWNLFQWVTVTIIIVSDLICEKESRTVSVQSSTCLSNQCWQTMSNWYLPWIHKHVKLNQHFSFIHFSTNTLTLHHLSVCTNSTDKLYHEL